MCTKRPPLINLRETRISHVRHQMRLQKRRAIENRRATARMKESTDSVSRYPERQLNVNVNADFPFPISFKIFSSAPCCREDERN